MKCLICGNVIAKLDQELGRRVCRKASCRNRWARMGATQQDYLIERQRRGEV